MKLSFNKTLTSILSLLALTFSAIGPTPAHAAVGPRFAKPGGVTTGGCDSWGNACDLQRALTSAQEISVSAVWVMEGTYKPTVPKGRTATFTLIPGVSMYGGFAGTETSLSQRDPATHVTILSGESKAGSSDNSYHVVTGANGATLDGFTITAGNANGSTSDLTGFGGGILFDSTDTDTLTVTNCIISGNSAHDGGGGIASGGTLNITNSTFSANSANWGGGIASVTGGIASGGTLNITNSTFSGNSAIWGGGIYNGGTLNITNSTFSGNMDGLSGGIYWGGTYVGDTATITNSTLSGNGNGASYGGGIYVYIGTMTLRNTIVSGGNCGGDTIIDGGNNIDDSTTCGWGGSTKGSMSNTNPLLGPLANNGGPTQTFALLTGSPAIDGVKFNAPNSAPSTDQRGVTRPRGARYDIGAYERAAPSIIPVLMLLLLD